MHTRNTHTHTYTQYIYYFSHPLFFLLSAIAREDDEFDILRRILDLIFCSCYLASQRPTFGHYQGVSLTKSILISALKQLWPDVNGNLIAKLGHYKLPGDLRVKIVEGAVIKIKVVGLSFW